MESPTSTKTPFKRLESLDVLRGFDLFCLVALYPILASLRQPISAPWFDAVMTQFGHHWSTYVFWDIIMPLFMFMVGVAMPFALSKYIKEGESGSRKALYFRIVRRFVLLWICGMICQGRLLQLDPHTIVLFSNTLQAIAVGYLFSAIIFLNFRFRTQIAISAGLLITYWAAMMFIKVGAYGGGDFSSSWNLCEYVDRAVLGSFRDGVTNYDTGRWLFSPRYHYTWILSSLTFVVTVMTGVFAGTILKSGRGELQKVKILAITGLSMVVVGWIWHMQMPVIKMIWTSSMVLISSGYCFLLMALFYYIIDYKGYKKGLMWLKIFGMNSIAAYMIANVISFRSVSVSIFGGFEQYLGEWFQVLIAASNVTILFLILLLMYRQKVFLKL